MINVDNKQHTPGATRSKQVAIFVSESDRLIRYCTRFSSLASQLRIVIRNKKAKF